ncbi:MAG: dihydroorotate dehydrogenase [Bacilli bacterium]
MNTNIKIKGLDLINPIIPASGTFGFGHEFMDLYDLNSLGAISLKGTTLEPRHGNPLPRIAETSMGMLNAIGLQNPGALKVIQNEIPHLRTKYQGPIIANIAGSTIEDYLECATIIDQSEDVAMIELNVSCPNVKSGGIAFGSDETILFELITKLKAIIKKPIYVKLSPNVTDIVTIAKTCEKAGVDGFVMINTLVGMKIDVTTRKPIIANKIGGFSGPAIKPIAIRMIYQVYEATKLPIIGCGGVKDAYDVIEMMLAGASAIQVGSENLIDPWASLKIITSLPEVMAQLNITNLSEIIGGAHNE